MWVPDFGATHFILSQSQPKGILDYRFSSVIYLRLIYTFFRDDHLRRPFYSSAVKDISSDAWRCELPAAGERELCSRQAILHSWRFLRRPDG